MLLMLMHILGTNPNKSMNSCPKVEKEEKILESFMKNS